MEGYNILFDALRERAKNNPQDSAIIEADTGNTSINEALLDAVIALQEFFGEKKVIMVALSGGILDAALWLVALCFGHLLIPVSPSLTEFEYEELIQKYTPDFLITEKETKITEQKNTHLVRADLEDILAEKKKHDTKADLSEGSVYLLTSGSTGNPKGIILSATKIVITAKNIVTSHALTQKDRGLTPLPFYHVNAPVVSLISSILSGGSVVIAQKYSTSHFWEWVEKYQPTWISIVPTIATMLLRTTVSPAVKKTVRFIRTASAPLPRITFKEFEEKFAVPLIETYGITEAAATIAANPLPPKKHKAGSVGLPLLSMEIREPITFEALPAGKTGEVWIQGKQVIDSYVGNVDADAFISGWFRTGDLGYFDTDGYLFLTGRKKEVIIHGGENIAPREIEEVIFTYPGVQEVAVVGVPNALYGENIAAFVVTKEKNPQENVLRKYLQQKLSPQKIPGTITFLDTLPKGKTNKIDKNKLKNMYVATASVR